KTIVKQMTSPDKYIRTRARELPLFECWVTEDWQEQGMGVVIVSRKHSNGNVTFASYLADMLCMGLTDTYFGFNEPESEFREFISELEEFENLAACDYTLAHNIIYGAIGFASDYGFSSSRDFEITKFLLE